MLAIRLMQLFSENKEDFTKLTAILGLYFQIRDDYCNLSLKEVITLVLLLVAILLNFLCFFKL